MFLAVSAIETDSRGLLGALPKADIALLASGALVFGTGRLVPNYPYSYEQWYPKLEKPRWASFIVHRPWIFPAVWIPLKCLQAVAAWLVWKAPVEHKSELVLPLTLFGAQLLVGNAWNVVFFGRRQLKPSTKWMAALYFTYAGTIASFYQVDPLAAGLLAPTQVWLTIAAKLNADIVRLNSSADD